VLRRCVCDLETSRIGAPYIYNVRLLRVNKEQESNLILPEHDDDDDDEID